MKKLIILFVMFLAGMLAAQNWTTVKETNISVVNGPNNAQSVDIFTNGYGNHIIVQWDNSLLYYNMDVNGVAGNPVTLENSAVFAPSICGDANNIYVVYRKSNEPFIRTKHSTDGGNSWSYLSTSPTNSNANSIESVFSNNKLHITFTISNVVYYAKYENQSWSSTQTVSTGENGTMPRITAWYTGTQDKVYFLYRKNSSESRWREYNVALNNWGNNPQTAFTTTDVSYPAGFMVDDTYLTFYYSIEQLQPQFEIFFQSSIRKKSDNSLISESFAEPSNLTYKTYTTTTANNVSHTVFFSLGVTLESIDYGLNRARGDGSGTSNIDLFYFDNDLSQVIDILNLSSSGNDVYVVWQDNIGGNNLRLIYDDADPLAPQNLQASQSANNHPLLNWSVNNEPDLSYYEVWKKGGNEGGDWHLKTTTSDNFYEDPDETVIRGAHQANEGKAYYKLKAVDINSNKSTFSNQVEIRVGLDPLSKTGGDNEDLSKKYILVQNYPNPFNPSTQISYSLAQDADVTIKVYDMLGTEIAKLVNETQTAGNHTINFDAKDLSSGVYIYRITATNNGRILFAESKQMILLR